jgi:hypothetical protein
MGSDQPHSPTFVADAGDLRRYRTEIPNVIDDMDLSLQAYRLYGHLKRVAGDSGVCWQGTRSLADHCKMGVGSVSRAKSELAESGLITIEEGDRFKGQSDTITIADVWLQNMQSYAPSSEEHPVPEWNTPCSSEEHPCSSVERKKEPTEEGSTERLPNGSPKKAPPSSPPRIKKLNADQAGEQFDALCESDSCGGELRQLAEMLASENKTGEVAITRVWNELGSRYIANRERYQLSDEAWRYGFERAISAGAPNIGYVVKAAKGYRPEQDDKPRSPQGPRGSAATSSNRRSLAVVGATDADYEADPFDYEGKSRKEGSYA